MMISFTDAASIKKSKFIRNVGEMLTGNLAAQTIALLAAPVITRLYPPASFGIMSVIWSMVAVFSVAGCFCYQQAIVLPSKDNDALNLLALSFFAALLSSMVLSGAVFGFKNMLADLIGISGKGAYLWFIPATVLLTGWHESLLFVQTRFRLFRIISISAVILALTTAGLKILFGSQFEPTAFWLLAGNLFGLFISLIYLLLTIKGRLKVNIKNVSLRVVKRMASEFHKFPRYSMPTALINSLSQNIPIFMFAYYFNQEVVGFYGLANTVLRRPIGVMSQSISKVFLQKSADLNKKGESLHENLKKATIGLAMIGVLPFGILTLAGKWIFSFVFGADWSEAGMYAQILALWLFFGFINPPANQIIIVKQKLRFKFYYDILILLMRILSIYLAVIIYGSPLMAVMFFSICGMLWNIYLIIYSYKISMN